MAVIVRNAVDSASAFLHTQQLSVKVFDFGRPGSCGSYDGQVIIKNNLLVTKAVRLTQYTLLYNNDKMNNIPTNSTVVGNSKSNTFCFNRYTVVYNATGVLLTVV